MEMERTIIKSTLKAKLLRRTKYYYYKYKIQTYIAQRLSNIKAKVAEIKSSYYMDGWKPCRISKVAKVNEIKNPRAPLVKCLIKMENSDKIQ